MTQYLFIFLSALTIGSALMVVISKKAMYSVLYLVFTLFTIAAHFILLKAEFLAIVQVIVYAGAIMVLFLFVVMLLNLNLTSETPKPFLTKLSATMLSGIVLVILTFTLKNIDITVNQTTTQNTNPINYLGTVSNLGRVLFKDFLIPFEVVSVLFLAAMIGAVLLGKKDV